MSDYLSTEAGVPLTSAELNIIDQLLLFPDQLPCHAIAKVGGLFVDVDIAACVAAGTPTNGLQVIPSAMIGLGGTLIQNTVIDCDVFSLVFDKSAVSFRDKGSTAQNLVEVGDVATIGGRALTVKPTTGYTKGLGFETTAGVDLGYMSDDGLFLGDVASAINGTTLVVDVTSGKGQLYGSTESILGLPGDGVEVTPGQTNVSSDIVEIGHSGTGRTALNSHENYFDVLPNDNTMTNLMAWDASTKQVFYRDLSSIVTGGISSLNGLLTSIQTFSNTDDTNMSLTITSAISDHNFALAWTGELSLARGGTGSNLTAPTANRLWGWDKTDGAINFWTIGTGLSYNHTTHTLNSTGLVAVTSADTTPDYLSAKLSAGTNIAITTVNPGANEKSQIAITGQIPVANGGTGRASHTPYAVIIGGTTTTGAQQSVASVGTLDQVLTSNGAGAAPTFKNNPANIRFTVNADENIGDYMTTVIDLPWYDPLPSFNQYLEGFTVQNATFTKGAFSTMFDNLNSGYAYNRLFKFLSVGFDTIKEVRLKFSAATTGSAGSDKVAVGLSRTFNNTGNQIPASETNICESARFVFSSANTIYMAVSNDTANTNTNTTAYTVSTSVFNVYEIVFIPGVSVDFYINGLLVSSLTTNIPSTSNDVCFFMSNNTGLGGSINISKPVISIKR